MKIILLGPPGSGKTTQASILSKKLNVAHISVGKLLKNIVSNPEHPFHKKVKDSFTKGELVEYALVDSLVYTMIDITLPLGGFIMDGFPRVQDEIDPLDIGLSLHNTSLDLAIYVDTTLEESKRRLLSRNENRPDDTEEIIVNRFKIYNKETLPVLHIYKDRGILRKVDGNLDIEGVSSQIDTIIHDFD